MALHQTAGLLLARSMLQCTAGVACAQHSTALEEQQALLQVCRTLTAAGAVPLSASEQPPTCSSRTLLQWFAVQMHRQCVHGASI